MDYFNQTADPGYDPILGILPTAESLSHGGYETGALLTEPEQTSPLPVHDILSPEVDALTSSFTLGGPTISIGGDGRHVHDPSASQQTGIDGENTTTASASASHGLSPDRGPRPTQSLPPTRAASISSHASSTDFRTMRPRGVRLGVDPKATVWECFTHEATTSDRELFRGWREGLDNQTLTAALFAGILSGFLIDHLNPDPGKTVAAVLVQAFILSSTTSSSSTSLSPEQIASYLMAPILASPSVMDVSITLIWSMSFLVCIGVVIFSLFIRHWLSGYDHELRTGSTFDYVQRRQLRYGALNTWNVPTIIPILQLSMIGAVFLFLGGWSLKLFQFHTLPASLVSATSGLLLLIYTIMTVLPLFFPTCPYHNTILVLFLKIYHSAVNGFWRCGGYVHTRFMYGRSVLSKAPKSSPTLPMFMNRPRQQNTLARREQEYMQHIRRALIWDAVIWLLSSSRNALTIDTALRSIFSLKYVPQKMASVLSSKVPGLLYSKLALDIPSEELYSTKDLVATIQMRDILGRSLDLMMSYLHLWKCISLDGVESPYQLSLMSGGRSPQVPETLYPELMSAWKALRVECNSLSQVSARMWPIESLAVAAATEAIYFSLQSTSDKTASQMGIVNHADHPLREMEHILEWHLGSVLPNDTYLHQDVLMLLLDSLAHVLFAFDSAVLRQDALSTLDLLQRLLRRLEPHHFQVFSPLHACFIMYIGTPKERRYALEQRINLKPETRLRLEDRHGYYLQLVDTVGRLFTLNPGIHQATALLMETACSLYKFTYAMGQPRSPLEKALSEMPGCYADEIVKSIQLDVQLGHDKPETGDWTHRPLWVTQLLCESYSKPGFSIKSKLKANKILESVLATAWPDDLFRTLASRVLGFVQVQLHASDCDEEITQDLCEMLIAALSYSLENDLTVLRHFVSLRLFETSAAAILPLQNWQEVAESMENFLDRWNIVLQQYNHDLESHYEAYNYLDIRFPRGRREKLHHSSST